MNQIDTPCAPELRTCLRDLSRQAEPFAAAYFLQHHMGHCATAQIPGLLKAHAATEGRSVAVSDMHVTTAVALDFDFGSTPHYLMLTQLRAAGRVGAACEAILLAADVVGIAEAHALRGSCFGCPRFASSRAPRPAGTAADDA